MGADHLGEPNKPVHSYTMLEGKKMREERQKETTEAYRDGYNRIDWSKKLPKEKEEVDQEPAHFSKKF